MTYIASLAKVKVDLHAKDEARRSNGSTVRAHTNGQTDATKCIISLASRSIMNELNFKFKRKCAKEDSFGITYQWYSGI